jgi:hypothetical protein
MTRKALSIVAAALALHLGTGAALANSATASHKTLTAFASEAELSELFRGWAEEYRKKMAEQQRARRDASGQSFMAEKAAQAPASAAPVGALAKAEAAADGTNAARGVGGRHRRCTATAL